MTLEKMLRRERRARYTIYDLEDVRRCRELSDDEWAKLREAYKTVQELAPRIIRKLTKELLSRQNVINAAIESLVRS